MSENVERAATSQGQGIHLSGKRRVVVRRYSSGGFLTPVKALLEIVVIALFVVTFITQPYRIPSESMEPTLLVGDFLLVDKQSFGPSGLLDKVLPPEGVQRGDLVVFHFPPEPTRDVVKRVVGLPGDRLRMREGKVYINDAVLGEPYAFHSPALPDSFRDDFPSLRTTDPNADPRWWAELRRIMHEGEITVPAASYFVMGDNRNNSEDSRYWGFVPAQAMEGRPLLVYYTTATQGVPANSVGERLRSSLSQVRVLR